ncbi:MAG TPA: hypothetical protein VM327_00280 [Candidatus Thermoplasmatota archaeon]|nr:hypothetical protein [Candidatus Thermoplasmatota archaeon]
MGVSTGVGAAVVFVAGLVSGCVGLGLEEPVCGEELEHADLRTPWVDGSYLRTDPSGTWDTLMLQTGHGDRLEARAFPDDWSVEMESLSAAPRAEDPAETAVASDPNGGTKALAARGGDGFSVLRVSPGSGKGRLDLAYAYDHCDGPHTGTITWDLAKPVEGERAMPGKGVHVYTAGFLEDGTLFYTNIKAIDHDDWPRTEWYAWEGDKPLPVYVYEQDRAEEPAVWKDPQSGTPADGTVPGLGYYTTIPGFNDALKGLSTNTVRVVRMEPEEGYTRAGNEDHPLYGEALVFYIKVEDVVPVPCPMDAAWLCSRTPLASNPEAS